MTVPIERAGQRRRWRAGKPFRPAPDDLVQVVSRDVFYAGLDLPCPAHRRTPAGIACWVLTGDNGQPRLALSGDRVALVTPGRRRRS